jgi:hypothetical protein
MYFPVVYRNKYQTIIGEQISGNEESRINHTQPVGMISPAGFWIGT